MEIEDVRRWLESAPQLPEETKRALSLLKSQGELFPEGIDNLSDSKELESRILATLNSPFMRMLNKIPDITTGKEVVSSDEIKSLALASTLTLPFFTGTEENANYYKELWTHSILVGLVSRYLAEDMGQLNLDSFYLAGMLHDTGSLLVPKLKNSGFAGDLKEGEAPEKRGTNVVISHDEIGATVLGYWRFPVEAVCAARFHHRPWLDTVSPTVSLAVHFAESVIGMAGLAPGYEVLSPESFLESRGAAMLEEYDIEPSERYLNQLSCTVKSYAISAVEISGVR